jgi:ABC-type amino acid transport substrate-binding protein
MAAQALKEGKIAAILAPRAELEANLAGETRFPLETPKFPELRVDSWPLGMAVKAEEMALAEALGAALADLKRDGTLAAIFKRHGITYLPA